MNALLITLAIVLSVGPLANASYCEVDGDNLPELHMAQVVFETVKRNSTCQEEVITLKGFYTETIFRIQFVRSWRPFHGVSRALVDCTHTLSEAPSGHTSDLGYKCRFVGGMDLR